jgi:hypothetical protein
MTREEGVWYRAAWMGEGGDIRLRKRACAEVARGRDGDEKQGVDELDNKC